MIACLLIHGYTGGPYELDPLTNYLKENTNWHIQVPTLPGHGKNLSLANVSHEKWIDVAEQTFLQLKERYDEIYLIGFSMGGMIAAYLAAKYHVDKLVLLAPAVKYISLKQLTKDIHTFIKDGFKGKLNENRLFVNYKRKLGMVPLKANIEFMRLIKFTKKYLRKVQIPVLVAQGQLDSMVPYKTAYYIDKEIPSEQKEVILLEKSRHLMCLGDDKDTLNQMVHAFLKGTRVGD